MLTQMSMSKETTIAPKNGGQRNGGHLYMQTNEIENCIIHYHWSANGALTEVERVATGGAGSGTFKPISRQESVPNAFEGAGSVNLTEISGFYLPPTDRRSAIWQCRSFPPRRFPVALVSNSASPLSAPTAKLETELSPPLAGPDHHDLLAVRRFDLEPQAISTTGF
jgi:hypothetical protein